MRYDLAALARQAGRRRSFPLPQIRATNAQADALARIYLEAMAAWSKALPTLLAAYERALAVHTRDSIAITDDAAQARATVESVADAIDRLLVTLTPKLRNWAVTVDRWHRGKWASGVQSAAGVDLTTVLGPADSQLTVDVVLARNIELVRNVSDEARGRIADIVLRGVQAQTPPRTVAREMNDAVGLGRKRSLRIAADQATKLTGALSQSRQQRAGINKFKWRWSHKQHGRPEHIARDGKIFSWDNLPADGPPSTLPFCGCRAQAWIDLQDE